MPVGVIVNSLSVLLGGFIGAGIGPKLPQHLKKNLPPVFGICSIGIGVTSIIKANAMTAVVLAILLGFTIGELTHLERFTEKFFHKLVYKLHLGGDNIDMEFYITSVALFCCSGFGWYGALTEGIAGDASLLLSKSVLDFFTALVFAASLGLSLCAIPFLQIVVLLAVYFAGHLLAPLLAPTMFADLCACGGILTLGAALRVAKIKSLPVINLMPALLLILPISALYLGWK